MDSVGRIVPSEHDLDCSLWLKPNSKQLSEWQQLNIIYVNSVVVTLTFTLG